MGTRADFYIGRGKDAIWIGSTAWDGNPESVLYTESSYTDEDGARITRRAPLREHPMAQATTPEEFVQGVEHYFDDRSDVSRPESGWPWPWDDSGTTDYSYAFDNGQLHVSCYGSPWFQPHLKPDEVTEEAAKAYFEYDRLQTAYYDEEHEGTAEEAKEAYKAAEATYRAFGDAEFPDMSEQKNVARGHRSGMMMIGFDETGNLTIE